MEGLQFVLRRIFIKDTHKENTPSNTTETLSESMNMYLWAIGTSNQLFIRGSSPQTMLWKNEVVMTESPIYKLQQLGMKDLITYLLS